MPRYLFVITTRLGWKVFGDRLSVEIERDRPAGHLLIPYTPWPLGRRLSRQTRYNDRTLAHLPLFDPFTVTYWHASHIRRTISQFDAVIAATQAMAFSFVNNRWGVPVFAIVDATRNLYRTDFGAKNITDAALARERSLFRSCRHVFALSSWVANDIMNFCNLPIENVSVVPPPVGIFDLKKRDDSTGKLRMLFVGMDFERKGGRALLEWQRDVLHDYASLFIVTDSAYRVEGVPDTIWLSPMKNERLISEIMPAMDVLCHPTSRDCSALVVTEAAMAGIPSITTKTGGIPDLVEHGVTGYLFHHNDGESFIRTIVELYSNRALLKSMGKAARNNAIREFSAKHVYDTIIDKVGSLL